VTAPWMNSNYSGVSHEVNPGTGCKHFQALELEGFILISGKSVERRQPDPATLMDVDQGIQLACMQAQGSGFDYRSALFRITRDAALRKQLGTQEEHNDGK
jgi:hypothetical protein